MNIIALEITMVAIMVLSIFSVYKRDIIENLNYKTLSRNADMWEKQYLDLKEVVKLLKQKNEDLHKALVEERNNFLLEACKTAFVITPQGVTLLPPDWQELLKINMKNTKK